MMPALACLLLVLWSCNGIVSAAKADTDGGTTACPACPEIAPVNEG